MNDLLYVVAVPIAVSLLCFIFSRAAKWLALLTSAAVFILSIFIFLVGQATFPFFSLRAYPFSSFFLLASSFFTFLIVLFSFKFMEGKDRLGEYYGYILLTLGAAAGVFLANDWLTLLIFWGILGITLYMLIGIGGPKASGAAKKTFIIVGGADALMIFGIGLIFLITASFRINAYHLPLNGILPAAAFICLAVGAFAKAGAIPFHSWIPDCAEPAPATVMAYLPASLDKLAGIYLLARLCLDVFQVQPNSPMSIFLLLIGSWTIIAAVAGALVQHNLKKLLSFHAVSQVGYMVLGIGTGVPIGIAGGLFHMLNHSIYKSCLFLTGAGVEHATGTTDLEKLGGLAKFMPLTFISALVAAFSISGIPPFNGFVSKWMVYQGVIELGKTNPFWIVWLAAAMFGSALTLASFIKLIHATFLGQWSPATAKAREVPWQMWLPMIVLAVLCVVLGIFAFTWPLKYFIYPAVEGIVYQGVWQPQLATGLIILGLLLGLLIYALGRKKQVTKPVFIGGEILAEETVKVSGVNFYDTIKKWGLLGKLYEAGEKKDFDIYEIGSKGTFAFSDLLRGLHNGLLHTYLAWMFLGVIILLVALII